MGPRVKAVAAPSISKAASKQNVLALRNFPEFPKQLDDYFCNALHGSPETKVLIILVELCGLSLPVVLDSGSTATHIGQSGLTFLEEFNLSRRKIEPTKSTIANGEQIICDEEIELPLSLEGRKRTIHARVSPVLPIPLLLGLDSLNTFGIVIDHLRRVWSFSGDSSREFRFLQESDLPENNSALALTDLVPSERERLATFLEEVLSETQSCAGDHGFNFSSY